MRPAAHPIAQREQDLAEIRRIAEASARERGQKATTTHLLAALATGREEAAQLLLERRLDAEVILRAARVTTDDAPDGIARAIQRAKDVAGRTGARGDARAIHLLFALCQEPGTAAHRTLVQCGADITRLRTASMQLAMGLAPPRRPMPVPALRTIVASPPPPASTRRSGVVPVAMPVPAKPKVAPAKPAPLPAKAKKQQKATVPTPRFELDAKQYPLLTAIGKNLTALAARGELDPVVGREPEIERVLDVLAKRERSNACLVGGPGVGKTSVARGLAQRIADGDDVACFEDSIVIGLEPTALLAGTGVRGSLAERIAQVKSEIAKAKAETPPRRVLVFFDEVHVLFGPDAGDEAASELKLALGRGDIACIGATTEHDYRRTIDADPGLARCFTPIEVTELGPEEAMLATMGVAPLFEKHHGCTFSEDAIAKSITWSVRYLPNKALPDKAVQILDLAGARTRRRGEKKVEAEQVAEVVSELAGVPEERLLETDAERLLRIEELLGQRIVGHRFALEKIATVLRRNASGFRSRRPIGTFLLLGPTGVGKTETAKAIAECLFHSADAMTRLDLSEYAESHAIARLVGAPPGYVGHDSGGQLTESVRRRPYQVVLLDEIEKAHRDVLEGFLGVFDEGRLTDGRGRTVDFTNTVILLTSNIGAEISPVAHTRGRIGFGAPRRDHAHEERETNRYREAVTDAARKALPPELFNRLDEVLAFAPLTRSDVAEVARRILRTLARDLENARGVKLDASAAAVDALLDAGGFDPEMGARPMRRAIGRLIEAPIAEMLLKGELRRGDVATVDVEDGAIIVDAVTPGSAG
ncbi:MAG: ATP-dependent Clp protease ATP-binding subunit [Labilithrix sp.]|nr:ATP-dependent Clp protease ATP-binding subunit [Labilithrix sp.]MCW5809899.1 ATP-dependent Clp protease ATP-binding subunit [Labilithrix sp.]